MPLPRRADSLHRIGNPSLSRLPLARLGATALRKEIGENGIELEGKWEAQFPRPSNKRFEGAAACQVKAGEVGNDEALAARVDHQNAARA